MAILFVGSTPEDLGGVTYANTTTAGRDPDFTPVGSVVSGDFDTYGEGFTVAHAMSAGTVTWYHFLFNTTQGTYHNVYADGHWFRIYSGATVVAELNVDNSDWNLTGGGQASAPFTPFVINTDVTYDVKVTADGVNITVEVFINGVSTASITYASALAGTTAISFDHFDIVWNTTSRDYFYSEVMITDSESTIGWRLASLEPLALGTHTDWDGSITALAVGGDGESLSSDVVGEKESWTLSGYAGPATTSGVRALVNKFFSNAGGGAGPGKIIPFVRHSATDVEGAAYTPEGAVHMEILDVNPQTTLGWDTADLATLEIGVKSET